MRNFNALTEEQWSNGHFVCVGLDSDTDKIPESVRIDKKCKDAAEEIIGFNCPIIDKTHDVAGFYKPNFAFYIARMEPGIAALRETIRHINQVAPPKPVILDCKDADIGNTNKQYVKMIENLGVDAITTNPYLGQKAIQPFLDRKDMGVFVLCRTSNEGAGEFQDRMIAISDDEAEKWNLEKDQQMPLYQLVAWRVSREWNKNGNCGLVVGATYPDELAQVRQIVGEMPILIPGVGTQGGDLEKTVRAGKDKRRKGMIINSSSGIIFASSGRDFHTDARYAATELRVGINNYR